MRDRLNSSFSSSTRSASASSILVFLSYLLWSLILVYPLPLRLFSHIPLGDEPAGTVPLFNLWTLQWNIDQLTRGYPSYWEASIFASLSGSFAFSETQPISALLAAPVWLGFQSPALGYNALILLFLTLNGWFAYWLLRCWGGTHLAALLTGFIMQTLPFVAQEMGVLQLVAIFGFLWSLLFLSRLMAANNQGQVYWPNAIGLALGIPLTFFTCGYYGLFSLLFLPLFFLFQFRSRHFSSPILEQLFLVGLLAFFLSSPFLWAQQHLLARQEFSRSEQTIRSNSAKLTAYAGFLDHNLLYGQILGRQSGQGQRLFPGLALMLLAGLALFGRGPIWIKSYLFAAIALALLLSMGLQLNLGQFQPYQWVRAYLPGFAQLRSPFRFAAFVQLHLALLAGFGLMTIERQFPKRGILASIVVAGVILVEGIALPLPLHPLPALQVQAPWQRWLNQQHQPPGIVILPFAASNRVVDFEQTTRWMLESRYFQGRMLNGYSGFFPRDHAYLRQKMLEFPTVDGLDLLSDVHISYVVVHHNLANAPSPEIMINYLPRVYHDSGNNVSIYALNQ